MAQHDYVIANGTGAAVRSDLNNALAAIVSQNSGATEPATMYAYQWWADTSTGLLKIRNAANNAWITLRELDGTLTIEDGTASSPGLAFADDLNTGIFSPGADQVAFTAGGTARLTATTTAVTSALPVDVPLGSASAPTVTFTGDLNTGIYSPGADQVAISTNGSGRLFVDSSGRVGVGTSSPDGTAHVHTASAGTVTANSSADDLVVENSGTGGISILTPDASNGALFFGSPSDAVGAAIRWNYASGEFRLGSDKSGAVTLFTSGDGVEASRLDASGRLLVGTSTSNSNTNSRFQIADTSGNVTTTSYSANNSSAGYYYFFKNRGASVDSHTVLQSGDGIANLYFAGSDGTTYRGAASIEAVADGGWSSGDAPGRLVFSTTADGASSPTERMRIRQNGSTDIYSSDYGLATRVSAAAGTSVAIYYGSYGATSTTTGTVSYQVLSNGNVQNTNNSYGAYSDIKLKENIVDANSQWDDLKNLQVRNYNFKEGQTHTQIGLIAQEVELVSPGLVTESPDRDSEGNDLGTVTKSVNYSVLYMKAVKALQEAMERIEQLETKVAALEAA